MKAMQAQPVTPDAATIHLKFERAPSNLRTMLGSVLAGRPALAAPDRLKVRFHAQWTGAQADPQAVRNYLALCEDASTTPKPPSTARPGRPANDAGKPSCAFGIENGPPTTRPSNTMRWSLPQT